VKAKVGDDELYGYIDATGRMVINPQFGWALEFTPEQLAAVSVGDRWGYIDKTGKLIINPQFNLALSFSEGLALVVTEEQYGYIDKTGKYVWGPIDGSAALQRVKNRKR